MVKSYYWLFMLEYGSIPVNYSSLPVLSHTESIDGNNVSFYGLGSLVNINGLSSHTDLTIDEITISIRLSYEGEVNNDGYNLITKNDVTGSKLDLYLVEKNEDNNKTIRRLFTGFVDSPTVSLSPTDGAVTIKVKNALLVWKTATHLKYSHEDHILDAPGDLGLSFVKDVVTVNVDW